MPDSLEIGLSALLATSGILGAYLWFSRPRFKRLAQAIPAPKAVTASIKLRQNQLPVLNGHTLLELTGLQGSLRSIQSNSELSQNSFDQDVMPVLLKTAEMVQRLPASESHHHAQPGGLLLHLIEVTDAALRMRRSMMLPRGAAIEEMDRLRHRWTYGVFLAALLHDIGKPLADLRITYFSRPDALPQPWTALSGSLPDHQALAYSVEFPNIVERDYSSHQRLPSVLMQQIVPRKTLLWLGEDPQLMQELTAYLSGEALKNSVIAALVIAADQESVANNLQSGSRVRFKTARATPLIERLMEALRRMLVDGTLSLNQNGFTAGWVYDGAVWMVPKTIADAVRTYLQQHENNLTGIPTDNNRLFDTWQEYGAIIINPVSNQAIWDILVKSDGTKAESKVFNALRFPLNKLFATPDLYPASYKGSIQIQEATVKITANGSGPGATSSKVDDTGAITSAILHPVETNDVPLQETGTMPVNDDAGAMVLVMPDDSEPVAVTSSKPVVLEQSVKVDSTQTAVPKMKGAGSLKQLLNAAPTSVPSNVTVFETVAVAQTQHNDAEPIFPIDEDDIFVSLPALSDQPLARIDPFAAELALLTQTEAAFNAVDILANRFMSWIQQSVERGALPFNRSGSPLHFVNEGMLLVSPAIFKQFQREHGSDGAGSGKDDPRGYLQVQSAIIKSGWAVASGKKDYLHTFVVDNVNKPTKPRLISLLLAHPERWFSTIPPSNPIIRRFDVLLDQPLDPS